LILQHRSRVSLLVVNFVFPLVNDDFFSIVVDVLIADLSVGSFLDGLIIDNLEFFVINVVSFDLTVTAFCL